MDSSYGGKSPYQRSRQAAIDAARKRVMSSYNHSMQNLMDNADASYQAQLDIAEKLGNVQEKEKAPIYSGHQERSALEASAYSGVGAYMGQNPEDSYAAQTESQIYAEQGYTTTGLEEQTMAEQRVASQDALDQAAAAQRLATQASSGVQAGEIGAMKDTPVNQNAINAEWQQYHSAWQNYYQKYYSDYYSKAAQNYLETEKLKNERVASGEERRKRRNKRLVPIVLAAVAVLTVLFLQYNRLIFAPIMAYMVPDNGSVSTSIEAVDPNVTQAVSPEPRLLIPKLNVDVPIFFDINPSDVMSAMNHGVAQFKIPGANAMPGQVGNLVISGHSAGDIYSGNPYKFIFSGLERLSAGDLIYVNYESVRYTYRMVDRKVVDPTDVQSLMFATDKPMLTLITCTPLGTSKYRLLIIAEQISPDFEGNATEEPGVTEDPNAGDDNYSMPANEPSFFEGLWSAIFGG